MKWIRDHWYQGGLIFFAVLAFVGLFYGQQMNFLQKLLLASLMALPLHQYEEYALPGGGPLVINKVFWGQKEGYMNYPGNWQSIMIVNLSAYIFYIAALCLPNLYWLGLATILFNLFQVLGHVFEMNIKGRTWYNPGMATSISLFLPISIAYIRTVIPSLTGLIWLEAVLATLVILLCSVVLPVQGMKNTASPYFIPEWQKLQYEKLSRRFSLKK
jgi:hypothetical protein